MTSTSRQPFWWHSDSWMSPSEGAPSTWRPTSWPGPKPSTNSLRAPSLRNEGENLYIWGDQGSGVLDRGYIKESTLVQDRLNLFSCIISHLKIFLKIGNVIYTKKGFDFWERKNFLYTGSCRKTVNVVVSVGGCECNCFVVWNGSVWLGERWWGGTVLKVILVVRRRERDKWSHSSMVACKCLSFRGSKVQSRYYSIYVRSPKSSR